MVQQDIPYSHGELQWKDQAPITFTCHAHSLEWPVWICLLKTAPCPNSVQLIFPTAIIPFSPLFYYSKCGISLDFTTAVIAWGLRGQSWVNLKFLPRQPCRNKFRFQRFILFIYSLSCQHSHCPAVLQITYLGFNYLQYTLNILYIMCWWVKTQKDLNTKEMYFVEGKAMRKL